MIAICGKKRFNIKILPLVSLISCIIYISIAFFVIDHIRENVVNKKKIYIIYGTQFLGFMILPFPSFLAWIVFQFWKMIGENIQIHYIENSYVFLGLAFSGFFSLFLTILIDQRKMRIENKNEIDFGQSLAHTLKPKLNLTESFDSSITKDSIEDCTIPIYAYKLYKQFSLKEKKIMALREVSFSLELGETFGIIGPNGAGKTTIFNILTKTSSLTSGCLRFFGQNIKEYINKNRNIGICAQEEILWQNLTINQHIRFFAHLKKVPKQNITLLKELFEFEACADTPVEKLSKGIRQRLCFCLCVMSNPKIKFLDEHGQGLDPFSKKVIMEIINHQKKVYGGVTVIFGQSVEDVENVCDRVGILVNGKFDTIKKTRVFKNEIQGFVLQIYIKSSDQDLEELENELKIILAENIPYSLNRIYENDIIVIFDLGEVFDLGSVFKKMENFQNDGNIKDFCIRSKDMEDYFSELSKNQNKNTL